MRVPVSWLTEHLDIGEEVTPQDLADAFVRIGIEVDDLSELGPGRPARWSSAGWPRSRS